MTVRRVRVGDVLTLQRERITPDVGCEYRQIGIYSWGKGIIENAPVSGADLSKVAYYRFPAGALVLSNIQAWEAAIAVSEDRHQGFIASQRFLPYVPRRKGEVDVRYLSHYFLSDPGMVLIRKASPGSVTRNRTLGISAFENLQIPLPSLDEQRAIAARLDRVAVATNESASDLTGFAYLCDRREVEIVERHLASGSTVLRELAEVNPTPTRDLPAAVHFVPMADVDDATGSVVGAQLVDPSTLTSGYKQFVAGDVIFARITPWMQNGKAAIFDGALARVGYGSTEFHVLRTDDAETAQRVHVLLRSRWFRSEAARHFTGTAGQQRVPAQFLRDVVVPDLHAAGAAELIDRLRDLDARRRECTSLERRRRTLATALPQAARNEVFASLM